MGTRGTFGFVIDGQRKISYNHWDSYPSGLGIEVLGWLRNGLTMTPDILPIRARNLRVVDPQSEPTDADIDLLGEFWDHTVGDTRRERPDWYQLLRRTQGSPGEILRAGVMEDGSTYGGVEWEYLIDFDAQTFSAADKYNQNNTATWHFSALPTDKQFIVALEGADA